MLPGHYVSTGIHQSATCCADSLPHRSCKILSSRSLSTVYKLEPARRSKKKSKPSSLNNIWFCLKLTAAGNNVGRRQKNVVLFMVLPSAGRTCSGRAKWWSWARASTSTRGLLARSPAEAAGCLRWHGHRGFHREFFMGFLGSRLLPRLTSALGHRVLQTSLNFVSLQPP